MIIDWMDSFNVTNALWFMPKPRISLCYLRWIKDQQFNVIKLISVLQNSFPSANSAIFYWVSSFIWLCVYCVYIQTVFRLSVELLSLALGTASPQLSLNWLREGDHNSETGPSLLNLSQAQEPRTWLRRVLAVFTLKTSHLVPTFIDRKWRNLVTFCQGFHSLPIPFMTSEPVDQSD